MRLFGVADTLIDEAHLLTPSDPNSILDGGCPSSVGSLHSVVSLWLTLQIAVDL